MSDHLPTAAAVDLTPLARRVAGLLDGVAEECFAAPTPCARYRVADLLRHLLGLTVAFRDAARKAFGPTTQAGPADPDAPFPAVTGDWRGRLRYQLDELAAAWREPGAWQGETQAGGVTLPAGLAGRFALNELLLHGWDLARATGQPFECDEESAGVALALLSGLDEAARARAGFGPALGIPAGATPLDRVVALGGRRPGWTP
ncbi:TIGR03086 family metal-binding protein [Streptomyces hoynatensis]|uniref:TIGR03086 family protein n=1 Tax=Streptomyces hoynatensis TaxID=1141874 RepID=A0A3A9Z7D4_9ACTN|nr:TIGR03086 family metal-binding protein [Streptomyces hoynatensis]RKN43177.1 TIGR03086 family protein [Streptomyces hoynatensis]